MSAVESSMIALGTLAPAFHLKDGRGFSMSRDDAVGSKGLLVIFTCNHCPYVKHIHAGLLAVIQMAQEQGIAIAAICSNDAVSHPQDSPEAMVRESLLHKYSFPYLSDASQEVAKAFGAQCTPDFFLFEANLRLAYRGQLDDSRPSNGLAVTGADLRAAVLAVAEGKSPNATQRPSIGCNIKWKVAAAPLTDAVLDAMH
jgi:peroxiredoxin